MSIVSDQRRSVAMVVALGALAAVGCRGATPPPAVSTAPPQSSVPAADRPSRADDEAIGQTIDADWPTETFNGQAGGVKKVVLDALAHRRALTESAVAAFDPAFRGERVDARPTDGLGTQSGVTLLRWQPVERALGGDAWRASLNAWLDEFADITATEVHTWELQLEEAPPEGMIGLMVREALWVVGTVQDGRVREDRLHLIFDLRRPADDPDAPWVIVGIGTDEGRTALGTGPFFRDVTDEVLPGGYDQIGAGIYTDGGPAVADMDGDGDQDLFLPRQHAPALLYANDGDGRFRDVTVERGLSSSQLDQGSDSGVFLDIDNDGRLDLAVGSKGGGIRIFRNDGEAYRDVTGAVAYGAPGEWMTLAAADYDRDGFIDLYATNYGVIDTDHQPESYVDARDGRPNLLLRNDGGSGRFLDATAAAGLDAGNDRWSYAAAWADYDKDADMDLWVANDFGSSQLFRNDGQGRFTEVSEAVGAVNLGNGMGVSWLDADGDLDLDLYLSNMQSFAGNRITRLRHFGGSEAQRQLYRRFSQGNTLLRQADDHSFADGTDEAGVRAAFWAWGSQGVDYDADGDTDIFGAAGFYTGDSTADT